MAKDIRDGARLSVSNDGPKRWRAKFEVPLFQKPGGPSYIKVTGDSIAAITTNLLAAAKDRGEDWEALLRGWLAGFFEPWIEHLADEHGVKLRKSPFLEVP